MERPPAPPEAVLIRLAREAADIRMAEAAKNAGVSVARWSQIESGSEMRSGRVTPVRARAGTIARMAREVGITPERMESEGQRPDAAEILREMERHDLPPSLPPRLQDAPPVERTGPAVPVSRDKAALMAPHVAEIEGRLAVWAQRTLQLRGDDAIGEIPDGPAIFPDRPQDAAWWDEMARQGFLGEKFTLWQMVEGLALLRVGAEERRQRQPGSGGVAAGLMRRLTRTGHAGRNPPDVTIRSHSAAF
jgi:transcriptional regulator with XRE-family HTH domain